MEFPPHPSLIRPALAHRAAGPLANEGREQSWGLAGGGRTTSWALREIASTQGRLRSLYRVHNCHGPPSPFLTRPPALHSLIEWPAHEGNPMKGWVGHEENPPCARRDLPGKSRPARSAENRASEAPIKIGHGGMETIRSGETSSHVPRPIDVDAMHSIYLPTPGKSDFGDLRFCDFCVA